MKYVLDTNTLIYFFNGLGDVSKKMLAQPPSEIAIPTVVLFELEIGIAKSLESTSAELAKTIHAHPTLSEMIMEAAGAADGVHLMTLESRRFGALFQERTT